MTMSSRRQENIQVRHAWATVTAILSATDATWKNYPSNFHLLFQGIPFFHTIIEANGHNNILKASGKSSSQAHMGHSNTRH